MDGGRDAVADFALACRFWSADSGTRDAGLRKAILPGRPADGGVRSL